MFIDNSKISGNQVHPSPSHWHREGCHTIPRTHIETGVEIVFSICAISHTFIAVWGLRNLLHWRLAPCYGLIFCLSRGSTHGHTSSVPPCQMSMQHHCRSLQWPYSQVYMGTFQKQMNNISCTQPKKHFRNFGSALAPIRTRFIFCNSQEGCGQDPKVTWFHLMPLPVAGERDSLFQGEGAPSNQVKVVDRTVRYCLLSGAFHVNCFVSYLSLLILLLLLFVFLSHCCLQYIVLILTHDLLITSETAQLQPFLLLCNSFRTC